jgi:cysteine desulfurase
LLYFDHNSTTPVDPRVAAVVDHAQREHFGNPSSLHLAGQNARQLLEQSRRNLAQALGAHPAEIIFTSGGTESNNLAIRGVMATGLHAITTAIEHPSVLESFRGFEVTHIRVNSQGVVNPEAIADAIRPETKLISVMLANNETGVVQPIHEIAALARQQNILLHCDGVQAVGKMPVHLHDLGIDLFSISGHKFYAPKGVGALFVRKGVKLNALHLGGRHERGLRAGTENVAGAMALDCALNLCSPHEQQSLAELRNEFERRLLLEIPTAVVNAGAAPRLPNTSNILFPALSGEALLIALDLRGICVSTGAACSSGSVEPSPVLLAMGLTAQQARGCIRFSFGRGQTTAQVETLVASLAAAVGKMHKGIREKQLASA